MTPRRVLPYLLLFLVLAGLYAGLRWRQERREAQESQAKKVFQVQAEEIGDLILRRGKDEVRLVKKGKDWELTKPVQTRADQEVIDSMLTTLAHLVKERDLGEEQDLKAFGLDQPEVIVEFSAKGQPHRLAFGARAPGETSYYALGDREHRVLLINAADKGSLDRKVAALRDKTLFSFRPEAVTAVTIKTGNATVQLARTGPQSWRWVGRDNIKVRGDRVEALLRHLHSSRWKDVVAEAPQDLRAFGLAPKAAGEVTVAWEQGPEALSLGSKTTAGMFARKGESGPLVLVDPDLLTRLSKTASSLEDRRLWAGPTDEVHRLVWGAPGKVWTAAKEKDFWKITGPEGRQMRQPSVRLEAALWKLTDLEYERLLPSVADPARKGAYLLEGYDGAGKLLFRLEELEKGQTWVEVRTQAKEQTLTALIPQKAYAAWQGEMERLAATPPKKD